jgi:hypothetical protein
MMRLTRTPRVVAAFVVAATGVFAGCSAVLGIEADRYVVAGNDAGDAAADAAPPSIDSPDEPDAHLIWGCINDPVPPTPVGPLSLKLFFNDVASARSGTAGHPVEGVDVHACSKLDLPCANPFSRATSDDAGIALLTVPGGFDGFYEVHANTYSPAILARSPMLASEYAEQGVATFELFSAGAALAGFSQDPALGIVIVSVSDCDSNPAAGVVFDVGVPGPKERVIYIANKLPSGAANQTDLGSGSAIVFNAPLGVITVSASFASDRRAIRTVTTVVRQGWVSFLQVRLDQAHVVAP